MQFIYFSFYFGFGFGWFLFELMCFAKEVQFRLYRKTIEKSLWQTVTKFAFFLNYLTNAKEINRFYGRESMQIEKKWKVRAYGSFWTKSNNHIELSHK